LEQFFSHRVSQHSQNWRRFLIRYDIKYVVNLFGSIHRRGYGMSGSLVVCHWTLNHVDQKQFFHRPTGPHLHQLLSKWIWNFIVKIHQICVIINRVLINCILPCRLRSIGSMLQNPRSAMYNPTTCRWPGCRTTDVWTRVAQLLTTGF